ncbi:MAG: TlpA family protein disulfide reductase [Prevotellaceae bacterium]|jgi:thiol-disulfide isomerase/thioredoxin|nr:TlpA family protein disulfide reductase [Prevotellaceae bacterium]
MLQKIYFYLTVISIITLFISCSFNNKSDKLQPKRTVISGKVINIPENSTVVQINFCNPLSDKRRFAQDLTTSGGTFCTTHDYVFAQNITIRYERSFINLYVVPGDSVFVTIDGLKFQQCQNDAIVFSGDNAEINEQLSRWVDYSYKKLPVPEFNPSASPDKYLQSIKQCFDVMQDTIAAYAQRNEMNDFMKQWAFMDYKFRVANTLLEYEDKTSRWRVFSDSIFNIYDEQNFQSMLFFYHLYACTFALVNSDETIMKLLEQGEHKSATYVMIEKLSENAPEGTVRDMILHTFVCNIMDEKPELYDSIPELKSFFSQPVIRENIESFVREKLANTKKPIPVTGETQKGVSYLDSDSVVTLPDIEVLPYLIERYKNKALYIDVWATWCGPCMEEMKDAPALHKYFAEKEVVFVNLCLESSIEKWLTTINKNAIKGENYYLDANASKLFMGIYNISGFPNYMLIDRNGQICPEAANQSNMHTTIKQIEACLR